MDCYFCNFFFAALNSVAGGRLRSSSPQHHFSPCTCHLTSQPEAGLWKRLSASTGRGTQPFPSQRLDPTVGTSGALHPSRAHPGEREWHSRAHSCISMPRKLLVLKLWRQIPPVLDRPKMRSLSIPANNLQCRGFCKVRKKQQALLGKSHLLKFFFFLKTNFTKCKLKRCQAPSLLP